MKSAHSHLKITNEQFDAICELLIGTLTELGVKQQELNEIGALVEPLRKGDIIKLSLFNLFIY